MWFIIVLIILLALLAYLFLKIIRLNLKCQQYLLDIDEYILAIQKQISLLIDNIEDKKLKKELNAYLDLKTSTINQKNTFILDIYNNIDNVFNSNKVIITNFEVKNMQNNLLSIKDQIDINIDKYNHYATQYNKLISIIGISYIAKIMKYKHKLYFKK